MRFLAALASLTLLTGCEMVHISPKATVLTRDRIDLPTTVHDGALYIDAMLNGKGPFRFLVDSGSEALYLHADVAAKSGLEAIHVIGGSGVSLVSVKTFQSGDLRLEDIDAVVVGPKQLLNITDGSFHSDGVAGIALFRNVLLQLDFPARQVSVLRPGSQTPRRKAAIPYTGVCPIVMMNVAGKPLSALVDTGSGFHLIIPELRSYPLVEPPVKDDGLGGFGFNSVQGDRQENAQLDGAARLGPLAWINPPLRGQNPGEVGNIGRGLLNKWTVVFDSPQREIYFLGDSLTREWAKTKGPEQRYRPGFFANIQGAGLVLVAVDAGGAFERAGLRPGDFIAAVDGVPAADFAQRLSWEGAATRRLAVQRGGAHFEAVARFQPQKS